MIYATLPYYLSQFSVAGEENEGSLCSKNHVLMSRYTISILRTLHNLCSSFNKGVSFLKQTMVAMLETKSSPK